MQNIFKPIQIIGIAITLMISASIARADGIAETVKAYGEAWTAHDVDKLVSLHAENSLFHLHVNDQEPAVGKDQIRAAFTGILTANPSYATEIYRSHLGPGFAVLFYKISGGPQTVLPVGAGFLIPDGNGAEYEIDAIDILLIEDGLVTAKHVFLDTETIRKYSNLVDQLPE